MKSETNATWEQMYRRLCSYKKKYGDCNVPCTRSNDEMAVLGNWVQLLRQKKKGVGGSLSQEQIDRLEKLGFVWNPFDTKWDQQYEELCEFQKKHGHCNVPKDGEHQLGYWVSKQRVQRNSGNMRQDRIDRLEMIGFVWDFKANNWEHMFGQLCEFKKKYGHCLVPASKVKGKDDDEFRSLGLWVQTQRQQKKGTRKSRIPQDRIDRLDEIGFVWEPRDATWNESFEELKKFREENGHCNVPKVTKKLHSWIDKQRNRYRSGKMRSDRKAKLDSVESLWDPEQKDINCQPNNHVAKEEEDINCHPSRHVAKEEQDINCQPSRHVAKEEQDVNWQPSRHVEKEERA